MATKKSYEEKLTELQEKQKQLKAQEKKIKAQQLQEERKKYLESLGSLESLE